MTFDQLLDNTYTPYSGEKNVCVVQDSQGRFFPGVRMENLSYPLTISPVQAALFSCLTHGGKPKKLILYTEPEPSELISYWEKEFQLHIQVQADLEWVPSSLIQNLKASEIVPRLYTLCKSAVIPNSDFPVSCFLETEAGFIAGVNIECSNWELGLCAERVAISTAISNGYRDFKSIHIMAPKSDYVSPCGACRQVLMEHLPQKPVHLYQNEREKLTVSTSQLLPYHFKSDSLRK